MQASADPGVKDGGASGKSTSGKGRRKQLKKFFGKAKQKLKNVKTEGYSKKLAKSHSVGS